jgi:hypothetical protein
MFNTHISQAHRTEIERIVKGHIDAMYASSKPRETMYADTYREGMDDVTEYCLENGLPTLGLHMVYANNMLSS